MVAVAVTEFEPASSSDSFSVREVVIWLVAIFVDDRGGGAIVKVAEILFSSLSSFSILAPPRNALRSGELRV